MGISAKDAGDPGFSVGVIETWHLCFRIDAQRVMHPAEVILLPQPLRDVIEVWGWRSKRRERRLCPRRVTLNASEALVGRLPGQCPAYRCQCGLRRGLRRKLGGISVLRCQALRQNLGPGGEGWHAPPAGKGAACTRLSRR